MRRRREEGYRFFSLSLKSESYSSFDIFAAGSRFIQCMKRTYVESASNKCFKCFKPLIAVTDIYKIDHIFVQFTYINNCKIFV